MTAPAGDDDRVQAVVPPSVPRRILVAAVSAISFGLSDLVSSRRQRWLIRAVLYAGTLGSSGPALRRVVLKLRQTWRRTRAAPVRTRRIGLAITFGTTTTAGVISFGWYRLWVRVANLLATRGVRCPRLIAGVASESLLFVFSARLRVARVRRAERVTRA